MADRKLAVEFDEKKVDAIFDAIDQCHLPGAAIGIALNGRPLYRKGFGLASAELPVVLSPTIRMRIGSSTKHLACLAYMLLCEEGKAGIDDPVGMYLPELHPITHEATLRQLMGHQGGLRDVLDICWQFCSTGRAITSDELLALYRKIDDVNAPPGTTWIYNNGGYLMLSAVIERITGQSLGDVLRERIFAPVGMHDTVLRRFDTDFLPNSATLHMTNASGGFERSYLGACLDGAGAVVSTVDDMLLWLAHMDNPVVGTRETWEIMKTPMTLQNGASTGYGLGLMTERYRGVETLHHGGWVMGGNSEMLKVPAAGLDVVLMVNRSDLSAKAFVDRILDACLPALEPVKTAVTVSARRVEGVFRSPRTGRIIQLFERDSHQYVAVDGIEMQFEPDGQDVLRPIGLFEFVKQAVTLVGRREKHSAIRFDDFGNPDELIALNLTSKPDSGAITGRYRSDAIDFEATIFQTDQGVRMRTVGPFGSIVYELECLADGIWRAKPTSVMFLGGILSFDGKGGALRFTTFRTWSLPFRRCDKGAITGTREFHHQGAVVSETPHVTDVVA